MYFSESPQNMSNMSTTGNDSMLVFELIQKVTVSVACLLSMVGSLLIIIAFFAFKETRSSARQILANLSIADFLTALWNFIGIVVNFKGYYGEDGKLEPSQFVSVMCQTQAFIAQYGTNVSILWTIWISLHILLSITLKRTKVTNKLLIMYYIISWGIPAVILIWFAIAGYLGYVPNVTPGWCTVQQHGFYSVIVGYTMYVYIAFIVLPVISIITWCYIQKLKRRTEYSDPYQLSVLRHTELKLGFIPVIFIILRIWGLIVDICIFHFKYARFEESMVGRLFVILKGVGDSSQGFANSILFIGFTASIRNKFIRAGKKLLTCNGKLCYSAVTADNADHVSPTETSPMLNASMRNSDTSYLSNSITKELSHDFTPSLTLEIHNN